MIRLERSRIRLIRADSLRWRKGAIKAGIKMSGSSIAGWIGNPLTFNLIIGTSLKLQGQRPSLLYSTAVTGFDSSPGFIQLAIELYSHARFLTS